MVRRTRAELREAKEKRDAWAEKEAWHHYVKTLATLDDIAVAIRFANNGPDRKNPGGRFYDNLGSFLHWSVGETYEPLIRPSAAEWDEFLKFLRRAEAAGKAPVGRAVHFEEWRKETRGTGGDGFQ